MAGPKALNINLFIPPMKINMVEILLTGGGSSLSHCLEDLLTLASNIKTLLNKPWRG